MRHMRIALAVSAAGLLVAGLAACSGKAPAPELSEQAQATSTLGMEAFVVPSRTINQLAQKADLVVSATLADSPRSVTESELSNDSSPMSKQIPMLVFRAENVDVLKGEAPADLEVARYDVERMVFEQQGSTPVNTPMVLFLRKGPTGVYGIVGVDEGLAPLHNSSIAWRAPAAANGGFPETLAELATVIS